MGRYNIIKRRDINIKTANTIGDKFKHYCISALILIKSHSFFVPLGILKLIAEVYLRVNYSIIVMID